MEKHCQVTGMTCDGCARTVTEKLSAVPWCAIGPGKFGKRTG